LAAFLYEDPLRCWKQKDQRIEKQIGDLEHFDPQADEGKVEHEEHAVPWVSGDGDKDVPFVFEAIFSEV
jgi:hypothetical protein